MGVEVLPGLARARLAPFCRPCGAAKASKGWGGALAATLIHACAAPAPSARGAPFWGPCSPPAGSGRRHPLGHSEAGLHRVHGPGRRPSLAAPAPAAALPVTAAATPNPGPLDLIALRRGRSGHDAKGAGQIVRSGNLPGGGGQLCPLSTARAASGVASAG